MRRSPFKPKEIFNVAKTIESGAFMDIDYCGPNSFSECIFRAARIPMLQDAKHIVAREIDLPIHAHLEVEENDRGI